MPAVSRAQVWQEINNETVLTDTGQTVTRELVATLLDEEVERLRGEVPAEVFEQHYLRARDLIASLCLDARFVDFLTLTAYEQVS